MKSLVIAASLPAVLLIAVLSARPQDQSSAPRRTFEVASIKPADPGFRGVSMDMPPGRIDFTNVSLKDCLKTAYRIKDFQLSGGPGWMATERYNIAAKADEASTSDEIREMLQSLLADRFGLKLHKDTKILPSYSLAVGKNGPKMHESEAAPPPPPSGDLAGQKSLAESRGMMRIGIGRLNAQAMPMPRLVDALSMLLDRPVVDNTGLKGTYDIKLEWTPETGELMAAKAAAMGAMAGPGGPGPKDRGPSADPSGPSIFTALQEQLGLKLEAQKGPVEVFVIDSAAKPTEN